MRRFDIERFMKHSEKGLLSVIVVRGDADQKEVEVEVFGKCVGREGRVYFDIIADGEFNQFLELIEDNTKVSDERY